MNRTTIVVIVAAATTAAAGAVWAVRSNRVAKTTSAAFFRDKRVKVRTRCGDVILTASADLKGIDLLLPERYVDAPENRSKLDDALHQYAPKSWTLTRSPDMDGKSLVLRGYDSIVTENILCDVVQSAFDHYAERYLKPQRRRTGTVRL